MALRSYRTGDFAVAIRENRSWLALVTPPQRQKLFSFIMRDALDAWRAKYLRRRIEKSTVLAPPFNYALDKRSPMVHTGKMVRLIGKGRIVVSKPRGAREFLPFRARLALPTAHPVPKEIRAVLGINKHGMLPDEIRFVVQMVQQGLFQMASGLIERTAGRGKNKRAVGLRLSPEQRRAMRDPMMRGASFRASENIFQRRRRRG